MSKSEIEMAAPTWYDGLIPKFDGVNKVYTSSKWAQDVEDHAEIMKWTPTQTLIVARRSLSGVAALWLRTEKIHKTFEELKSALLKEFPDGLNSKEAHELLCSRRKGKDESYYQYMLSMKELAKRGKIADYVAIQYIIEGITDYESNKTILYGATTYGVLRERLAIYENMKKNVAKSPKRHTSAASSSVRGEKAKESSSPSDRRCYKCGDKDHISSSCTKGVKCFKCGAFGHVATRCTSSTNMKERIGGKQSSLCAKMAAEVGSTDDIDIDSSPNDSVKRQSVLNVNTARKSVKCVEINGVSVEGLIDSGSDLNLVTEDLFFELKDCIYTKDNILLTGLGHSKVVAVGKFKSDVKIDDYCYNVTYYIVPRDTMPYRMILGQPFLNDVRVVIEKGVVNVMPQGEGELLSCLLTDTEPIQLSHIPSDIQGAVCDLVEQYTPVQTKETPLEMVIVLKDNIPVSQHPRRLSAQEQLVVDKQVEEWLQEGIVRPSFSEYASPLVLIKKKNGHTRVCVDYRKINEKMVKDHFPLPVIDDHLDKLSEAVVYSKLDLKDAFFHLKIKEDCIKYTSFVTPSGQFEFTRGNYIEYRTMKGPRRKYIEYRTTKGPRGNYIEYRRTKGPRRKYIEYRRRTGKHNRRKRNSTKILGRDRYEVVKVDSCTEGPNKTSSAADHMKIWPV
ncbi:hypothetical protein O3G_MSEX010867 [Manduca sexta]|uniref:CCHC-type domain-containing protein n=1 Tax=Manduca sexta TaxID=7130 RepID=A0A922CU49_MANSE|nr:hypothetical protein O3G_MSEX010867 [Manduca sexta]